MPPIPPSPTRLSEPIYQYSLFDSTASQPIVNVASVPQRSPFRYPGGKTWLVPRIRQWFAAQSKKPAELIEPFAGGGIVSLTAAFEDLADQVTMVELDSQVAAVWQTILSDDWEWLVEKIMSFSLTLETARAELSAAPIGLREIAFQTILRNRIHHGGILAPGSGILKQGENGKGLASRWYPQTLKNRIVDIQRVKHKINVLHTDGLDVLRKNISRPDVVCFIDPPYTAAGKRAGARLYAHNELDHEQLFSFAAAFKGDFLMTYDNADGVAEMACRYEFATRAIPMKNTHHAAMTELLIGRHLEWV